MGVNTARHTTSNESPAAATGPVKRRGLMFGLGAAGAAAVAVKLIPGAQPVAVATPGEKAAADAASGGGYRVTPHVKRYYETTQS